MTRKQYADDFGANRAESLSLDALVRDTAHQLRRRQITKPEAIGLLRYAGCCEPEIAEVVA